MRKSTSRKIVPLELRATLETYAGWNVSATDELDPLFSFTPPSAVETRASGGYTFEVPRAGHDVFAVLNSLLNVDDVESAVSFFRAFGPMDLDRLHGSNAESIRLETFKAIRDQRREFLLRGATLGEIQRTHKNWERTTYAETKNNLTPSKRHEVEKLFPGTISSIATLFDFEAHTSPQVRLVRGRDSIIGVIESIDIRSATSAALFLDSLSGYGWAQCKECEQPFKKLSRHNRKYCSPQCLSYATTMKSLHPGMSAKRRRMEKGRRSPTGTMD